MKDHRVRAMNLRTNCMILEFKGPKAKSVSVNHNNQTEVRTYTKRKVKNRKMKSP